MATFDSTFPTFLAKCAELHDLLLSVAFALFIAGIIVTVYNRFTHRAALHLLLRLMLLTSLLVFLPAWGNQIQTLLQNSILSGLGVDPSQVYQQYLQILVTKFDASMNSASWWNVVGQLKSVTVDLIVTAVLWIVGFFASILLFWAYILQKIILNIGYALSPLLIGFMAIPALKHTGTRYLLNLVGVLLWPLGWAVAALITQGILDAMTDQTFLKFDPTTQIYSLQNQLGLVVAAFWIIFSTISAPLIIQKVISYGALAGGELLAGGVSTAIQTTASTIGGAVTGAPLGPAGMVAAGGAAGAMTLVSTASGTGHAGSLINSLGGLGANKDDLTGDKSVRQLLSQLAQSGLPPILPKS
jgi:hypothetical protein